MDCGIIENSEAAAFPTAATDSGIFRLYQATGIFILFCSHPIKNATRMERRPYCARFSR
jgi:hypothetical protein